MTDTMTSMELRLADFLSPNQLLEGDIIKVGEDFFTIDTITETKTGVDLVVLNDFDEQVEVSLSDDETVELYVFVDDYE